MVGKVKRRQSYENIGLDETETPFSIIRFFLYSALCYILLAICVLAFSAKPMEGLVEPLQLPELPRSIGVVVPTYNEAKNLEELFGRLHKETTQTGLDYHVYIVDDDSQDGTFQVVQAMAKMYNVTLITRKEEKGLASAVLEGVKQVQADVIVVMDGDLSHPPELITAMSYQLITGRADFSIGSRYINNARVINWPLFRRIISYGATFLARPLTRVSDPMSGYFAFRKELLKKNIENVNAYGFKIGLEMIIKLAPQRVVELPYSFVDRAVGESKLKSKVYIDFIEHLVTLYIYKFGFLICGIVALSPMLCGFYLEKVCRPKHSDEKAKAY